MPTLYLVGYFEVEIDGKPVSGGSRAPEEISVSGYAKDVTKSLSTATTWDVWITGADEALTDFDFLYVSADQNVLLELVCDTNNGVGRVAFAKEIPAGLPFFMNTDDAMAAHTVDFGAGTEYVIDAIRIRNVSGQTTTVRACLIS